MKFSRVIPKDVGQIWTIFSSLRSRNYRLYFIGQGVSLIGTWMGSIALSWLVYRLTGSVFLLGLVGFTSQIPTLILSPFTGVLTDRYNRHKIMLLAQVCFMVQALTMALLVLFNLVQVWHIIVLSILFGIITAFDAPARHALVIDLIDKPEDLGNAIALNSAIFNAARLVGPAIAGITIAIVGEGICFLLNTASFIAIIYALLKVKISYKPSTAKATNLKESFTEGFHYTFYSLPIRTLLLLLAIMSLTGFPFLVLMPAYAKEILQGGSDTLGFLMSSIGAGALCGALYMAGRKSVLGLGRIISVYVAFMGLALMAASFSRDMVLSLVLFFIGGLSMILSVAAINTMLQTIADDDKRGRVMSFYAMALMGTIPIGNLLTGSIASGIGIANTLLIGGGITMLSGVGFQLSRKSLRRYIHPIYVNKGILPSVPDEM
ncbi:MAG: MFS transporter [Bacteroidales bacterium]|nr:MFS transporter [Bacteroidales bacterium]